MDMQCLVVDNKMYKMHFMDGNTCTYHMKEGDKENPDKQDTYMYDSPDKQDT